MRILVVLVVLLPVLACVGPSPEAAPDWAPRVIEARRVAIGLPAGPDDRAGATKRAFAALGWRMDEAGVVLIGGQPRFRLICGRSGARDELVLVAEPPVTTADLEAWAGRLGEGMAGLEQRP